LLADTPKLTTSLSEPVKPVSLSRAKYLESGQRPVLAGDHTERASPRPPVASDASAPRHRSSLGRVAAVALVLDRLRHYMGELVAPLDGRGRVRVALLARRRYGRGLFLGRAAGRTLDDVRVRPKLLPFLHQFTAARRVSLCPYVSRVRHRFRLPRLRRRTAKTVFDVTYVMYSF